MKLVENSRKLGNDIFVKVLTNIETAITILDKTLEVFDDNYLKGIDLEDYEGLSDLEIRYTILGDYYAMFNSSEFNMITLRIGEGTYFESRANGLFLNSLENFKFWYSKINARMERMMSITFKGDLEELALDLRKDLNYCVVTCFQLYLTAKGEAVQYCVSEYCALRGLTPQKFAEKFIKYFEDNRPNQPLFIKYPGFMEYIEETVAEEFVYDLVYLSSTLKVKEIEEIMCGKLEVDEDFIEELVERAQDILSRD